MTDSIIWICWGGRYMAADEADFYHRHWYANTPNSLPSSMPPVLIGHACDWTSTKTAITIRKLLPSSRLRLVGARAPLAVSGTWRVSLS